jgi:D-amino-acid oxidase
LGNSSMTNLTGSDVVVIGCGVIGLTTAIRLQETGRRVAIVAAAPPDQTTSSVAAAVWYPYKAYPADRVLGWSRRSFEVFTELARDDSCGVDLREGVEIWRRPAADPWWRAAVPQFRRATPADLPPDYRDGYVFTAPIIEMPVYLRWLMSRFERGGGAIEYRLLGSIEEALAMSRVVINCAGLGARDIVSDPRLMPIRGQIVRVRNPGLSRFVLDEDDPAGITYIIPRRDDVILGGTADEDQWDTTPDPAVADAILRRCIAIEPRLADAEILEHKVGLRPGRDAIRLEREDRGGRVIVHQYGHGGAGVTLSWGCAEEVVALLKLNDQ